MPAGWAVVVLMRSLLPPKVTDDQNTTNASATSTTAMRRARGVPRLLSQTARPVSQGKNTDPDDRLHDQWQLAHAGPCPIKRHRSGGKRPSRTRSTGPCRRRRTDRRPCPINHLLGKDRGVLRHGPSGSTDELSYGSARAGVELGQRVPATANRDELCFRDPLGHRARVRVRRERIILGGDDERRHRDRLERMAPRCRGCRCSRHRSSRALEGRPGTGCRRSPAAPRVRARWAHSRPAFPTCPPGASVRAGASPRTGLAEEDRRQQPRRLGQRLGMRRVRRDQDQPRDALGMPNGQLHRRRLPAETHHRQRADPQAIQQRHERISLRGRRRIPWQRRPEEPEPRWRDDPITAGHVRRPDTDPEVEPAKHAVHDQHRRSVPGLRVLHATERRVDHRPRKLGQALLVAPQIPSVARHRQHGEPANSRADGSTTGHMRSIRLPRPIASETTRKPPP